MKLSEDSRTVTTLAGLRMPGVALVALSAALWGSDGLLRRGLALELPAATVVVYEHLILVVLVSPLLPRLMRAVRQFDRREWAAAILVGAGASATATMLFTAAFRYGDPTTPLLLQKLQPFVAIGGAWIILGERLRPRFFAFFAAAVAGAYLISFADPTAVSLAAATPALLAVGAAALWGMGTVLGRLLIRHVDNVELTALRFVIGLPAAAAICLADLGPTGFAVSAADAVPLLLLAIVPGLLALMLYYRGLAATPASSATVAELAFPLSAVTLNYIAFGTTLTTTQWIGVLAVAATVVAMSSAATRGPRPLGVDLPASDLREDVATSTV